MIIFTQILGMPLHEDLERYLGDTDNLRLLGFFLAKRRGPSPTGEAHKIIDSTVFRKTEGYWRHTENAVFF